MTNKLNEQYFKAREEHKRNISPYAWGFIVLLFLSLLISTFSAIKDDREGETGIATERVNPGTELLNSLEEAPRTTERSRIKFDDLNFEIELHKNLKYSKYPDQDFVIAHSLDSSMLSYFIGEIPESLMSGNVEANWKSQLLSRNPTYTFKDSMDYTFISVEENGAIHKGIYKLDKSQNHYFVIQAFVLKDRYSDNIDKMINVINSFKRIN